AGETFAGGGDLADVADIARVATVRAQCGFQNRDALARRRQIDKPYFVEAALAQQFGRQAFNLVGGGDDERLVLAFLDPGQERAERIRRHAAIGGAGGRALQRLLDLVEPDDAAADGFYDSERPAEIALGLTDELRLERAKVDAQQRNAPCGGDRL